MAVRGGREATALNFSKIAQRLPAHKARAARLPIGNVPVSARQDGSRAAYQLPEAPPPPELPPPPESPPPPELDELPPELQLPPPPPTVNPPTRA